MTIKHFEKIFNQFFSRNRQNSNKITLAVDNQNIISDDKVVTEELIHFFQNATKSLNIIEYSYLTSNTEDLGAVDKAVVKYKNHPSILTTKNSLSAAILLLFKEVFLCDIEEELNNLLIKKIFCI